MIVNQCHQLTKEENIYQQKYFDHFKICVLEKKIALPKHFFIEPVLIYQSQYCFIVPALLNILILSLFACIW